MSAVNPTSSSQPAPVASTESGPSGPASAAAGTAAITTATSVSSLGELKSKAPEVYNALMKGTALTIISQERDSEERLKKMWREAREEAGET